MIIFVSYYDVSVCYYSTCDVRFLGVDWWLIKSILALKGLAFFCFDSTARDIYWFDTESSREITLYHALLSLSFYHAGHFCCKQSYCFTVAIE